MRSCLKLLVSTVSLNLIEMHCAMILFDILDGCLPVTLGHGTRTEWSKPGTIQMPRIGYEQEQLVSATPQNRENRSLIGIDHDRP